MIKEKLLSIVCKAAQNIIQIYSRKDFEIREKTDKSPLTIADEISHQIISEELYKLDQDIPILSEEGKEITLGERQNWEKFWLVDPLDGTKEFINRNGEFTVNIGLIENSEPVLGIINVPVSGEIYFGELGKGAEKYVNGSVNKISTSSKSNMDPLIVVQSRSHSGDEEKEFYSKYNIRETISRGSALKICMLAEGKADLYFRGGPTWEWDTAAGHAILKAAGGEIFTKQKEKLVYNKESLKNDGFIATSINLK